MNDQGNGSETVLIADTSLHGNRLHSTRIDSWDIILKKKTPTNKFNEPHTRKVETE